MKTRLARFTVSGYRNFGDPITIDFTDVHDYKFSQECIDDGIIMKMGGLWSKWFWKKQSWVRAFQYRPVPDGQGGWAAVRQSEYLPECRQRGRGSCVPL